MKPGRSIITLLFFVLGCACAADPATTAATPAGYVALQRDPLLVAYVHPYRLQQGRTAEVTPSGAMSANALFERGAAKVRYIEEQRRGTDFLLAPGLPLADADAIKRGLTILDYGFAWETAEGTFPGNPDVFHSASFFLEGSAQAAILLREADRVRYADQLATWKPKIAALARWLMRPENAQAPRAVSDAKLFSHRYYLYAAALAQADEVVRLPGAAALAATEAERGIKAQLPDGVNPERGGFDAGYQAAGLQFATRYWFFCPDPQLRGNLARMIEKGTDALVAKLDANGQMTTADSTRMGKEKNRDGVTKSFNHAVLVNVLVHAAAITGRKDFRAIAEKVGKNQVLPELSAGK